MVPGPQSGRRPADLQIVAVTVAALAGILAPSVLLAQTPEAPPGEQELLGAPRVLQAIPVRDAPPVIDGRLDDPIWQEAPKARGLTQRWPDAGHPATQQTTVRLVYDEEAIYVGMRLYDDDPDAIVAHIGRRNQMLDSDWARVLIDTNHDGRTAFEFAVTPAGSRRDVFHYDDTQSTVDWDGVWEVATSIDEEGWVAEFRIPLSQLRYSEARADGAPRVWGINFARFITRTWEQAWWAPSPPDVDRQVSLFGRLEGLEGLPSPGRLEILPYLSTDLTRGPADPGNPLHSSNELGARAGVDVRYGLTPELTLSGTVNPDFGQVEADPAVVNLTALETFFPEQRPFFQEGVDVLDFRLMGADGPPERLFHSRRIGGSPHYALEVPGGHTSTPSNVPILGATKLSGGLGGDWSVGVQSALTRSARAEVVDAQGETSRVVVEPPSHYGVLRAVRNLDRGRGNVGAIATTTHRSIDEAHLEFLHDAAYAGGLDGGIRFRDERYRARGWVAGSRVEGSPEALVRTQLSPVRFLQRPDAAHLDFDPGRRSLTGWAGEAGIERLTGRWTGRILGGARDAGFEVNDLGFQQLSDLRYGTATLDYNQYTPGDRLREWSASSTVMESRTFGGERLRRSASLRLSGELVSFWSGSVEVEHRAIHLGVHELRGGPALHLPAYTEGSLNLRSDLRRTLVGRMGVTYRGDHGWDGSVLSVQPSLDLRPSPRTRLQISPSVEWNRNPAQYIGTADPESDPAYLHGRIDQTTVDLTARISHAFTPELSLELYLQPFVSAGSYDEFSVVDDPRASDPAKRFRSLEADRAGGGSDEILLRDGARTHLLPDPDFKVRRLNANTVLRWEFVPGSTLYVVWTREEAVPGSDGTLDLRRDLSRLFGSEGTNVFMVKASYWLNP